MNIPLRLVSAAAAIAMLSVSGAAQQASGSPAPSQTESPSATPETEHLQTSDNAPGVSQVRIVRLSQVKGEVRLDRNNEQKFEEAFTNLPIVAGERLETRDGLAEVEFENNSSLRLTPNSLVEFPVLGRDASGATHTTVKLVSGSLYVSLTDSKGADAFAIKVGNETITLAASSHLRLDATAASAKLVVFKGSVTVADASGTLVAGKKKSIQFDTASNAAPVFAHSDGAAMFDQWDKDASDYHQVRSAYSTVAGSPYAYGVNDLRYYGSFDTYAGCGLLWRPYLASAAWNPYGSGVWSWYPAAGYSWVSPYPWGWTPFHSGSWEFCPSSGSWGWRPGGGWNGLNNAPLHSIRSSSSITALSLPSPPKAGQSTLVPVNVKSMPVSRPDAGNAFVFRGDSAGMGVPRGVFQNLGKISQTAVERGSLATPISDSQAARGAISTSRPVSTAAQANARSASAPAPASMGASRQMAAPPSASASHSGSAPAASGGARH